MKTKEILEQEIINIKAELYENISELETLTRSMNGIKTAYKNNLIRLQDRQKELEHVNMPVISTTKEKYLLEVGDIVEVIKACECIFSVDATHGCKIGILGTRVEIRNIDSDDEIYCISLTDCKTGCLFNKTQLKLIKKAK